MKDPCDGCRLVHGRSPACEKCSRMYLDRFKDGGKYQNFRDAQDPCQGCIYGIAQGKAQRVCQVCSRSYQDRLEAIPPRKPLSSRAVASLAFMECFLSDGPYRTTRFRRRVL